MAQLQSEKKKEQENNANLLNISSLSHHDQEEALNPAPRTLSNKASKIKIHEDPEDQNNQSIVDMLPVQIHDSSAFQTNTT